MTISATCLAATLLAVALFFSLFLFIPAKETPATPATEDESASARTGCGIVTVRKVGRTTSSVFRQDVHEHWEGSDSVELPQLPIEVTLREEPELYAEYMSPGTPAVRKYEIADDLYGKGYTLPWIGGLNEQYKREIKEAQEGSDPDAKVILERTPVDLTPGKRRPAAGRSNPSREDIQKHE